MNYLHVARKVFKYRKEIGPVVENYFFLRNNRDQNFLGSISTEDEVGVRAAVRDAEAFPGPIIEIGTLFGFTTQVIASLKSPKKALITVDNFSWNPFSLPAEAHKIFTRRCLKYCIDHANTTIFEGTSEAFYRTYSGATPSMVFIDANHRYEAVLADISWAVQAHIPVICGHDYHPLHPGVVRAVTEKFSDRFKVIGSVWVASGVG